MRRLAGVALRRSTVVAALAALALPASAAASPQPDAGKLRRSVERFVATGVPGAVALERIGTRTVRVAAGRGRLAPATPARASDRFRVGSITKTFVATVVLQLVGEGKLRLGDTSEHWLPGAVPNGQGVTVRQLLDHTSGLFDYTADPEVFAPYLSGDLGFAWTPQQLLAVAVRHPPGFPPGAHFEYDNTGYLLLGLIVQAVTGHALQDELRTRIFAPLKLRHTSFPLGQRIRGRHAHGYTPTDGNPQFDITNLSASWAWAAGAVVSTADDVAAFYRALLRGRLLSAPLLAQMKTTVPIGAPGESYGLGLWHTRSFSVPGRRLRCGRPWGHNGDLPGYHADAFVLGRREVVFLATTSNEDYSRRGALAQFDVLRTALCG
jgi:D-alanyl-D-alanine carboxypeptidase